MPTKEMIQKQPDGSFDDAALWKKLLGKDKKPWDIWIDEPKDKDKK